MFKPKDPSTAACTGHKLKRKMCKSGSGSAHAEQQATHHEKNARRAQGHAADATRAIRNRRPRSTWEGGGMALAWACRGGCSLATTSLAFPDDTYIVRCVFAFSPMC